jgi:sterol desaturase/sphingolipid hydroxylase (fatty acid hydroxylase superfamily)
LIDFREILILLLIFVPLERLIPNRRDQRILRRGWLNDTVYLLFNSIIIRVGAVLTLGFALANTRALVPAGLTGSIAALPLWAAAPLAIMVADVGFYAAHRLFHAVPFLWRFHAVHHSIEELDWLAAHRVHPVDQIFSSLCSALPLALLGFSTEAIAAYGAIYLIQSHLIHSNVRLSFGPLQWVFASPKFHHWHHANEPEAFGHNYSGQLLFMDWLFGTLRIPDAMPSRYGTDLPVPRIYPLQLLWPLTRPERAVAIPAQEPKAS